MVFEKFMIGFRFLHKNACSFVIGVVVAFLPT